MELTRWSVDQISRLSNHYESFKKFLTQVLEGERTLIGADESANAIAGADADKPGSFECRSDISSLLYRCKRSGSEPGEASKELVFFRELAPFFEAGFALRSFDGELRLEQMFIFGQTFSPSIDQQPIVQMPLPQIESAHFYRGRSAAVLKLFRLESVKRLQDTSAILFSPAADCYWIMICGRPAPWQALALEELLRAFQQWRDLPSQVRAGRRSS